MTAPFPSVITSIEELRGLVQPPSEMVCRKVINRLDEHCRALIAHAPFVALATSGALGDCDVSPRGDAALTRWAARGYVFECAPSENRAAHRGEPACDRARGRVPTRRTR